MSHAVPQGSQHWGQSAHWRTLQFWTVGAGDDQRGVPVVDDTEEDCGHCCWKRGHSRRDAGVGACGRHAKGEKRTHLGGLGLGLRLGLGLGSRLGLGLGVRVKACEKRGDNPPVW